MTHPHCILSVCVYLCVCVCVFVHAIWRISIGTFDILMYPTHCVWVCGCVGVCVWVYCVCVFVYCVCVSVYVFMCVIAWQ